MNKSFKKICLILFLCCGFFAHAQSGTAPVLDGKTPEEKAEEAPPAGENSGEAKPPLPSGSGELPYADVPYADLKPLEKMRLKVEIRRRISEKSKEIESLVEKLMELDDSKIEEFLSKEFEFLGDLKSDEKSSSGGNAKNAAAGKNDENAGDILMPVKTENGIVDAKLSILLVNLGGRGVGTAFVAEMRGKPFIVTNVHIVDIAANLTFSTITGETIAMPKTCFIGDGRDLAIMPLDRLPEGVVPLPFSEDIINDVKEGDEIIACGNSTGKGVLLTSKGKLLAMGATRIEVDASLFQGNSGGPIYHVKSKKIIGVASFVSFEDTNNPVYKSSVQKSGSPIKNQARYFCVRGDQIKTWAQYPVADVVAQGATLDTSEKKFAAIYVLVNSKGNERRTDYPYPELDRIVKEWADLYRSLGNSSGAIVDARKNMYAQLARLCYMEAMKVNQLKLNDYYRERQEMLHAVFMQLRDMATNLSKI